MDGIFVALIGLGGVIASSLIGAFVSLEVSKKSNEAQFNRFMAELEKHNAVQDERIRTLTTQVEKHNSIVERTYKLESQVTVLMEKSK